MTDEFILEEEEIEVDPSRRPFLIAAGSLAIVGILAVACIAILLGSRGPSADQDQISAIETQNAVVAVTNAAVTQTIAAMETEAAMPTNTPRLQATSTGTPIPTNTVRPTDTPVVKEVEEETPDLAGTSAFVAGVSTPTPIAPLGAGDGALPQTGIGTWAASIAGVLLIGALVAARRMRTS